MNLIAYAQGFTAFLLSKVDTKHIRTIILFGSAARGEAAKDSDIDIFIDIFEESKTLENDIENAVAEFYKSIFFTKYWHLLGIKNQIKPIVGTLDEWKDLKTSVIADGITLYGKYSPKTKGKNHVLLSWGKIAPESRRVWVSKTLYGYKHKNKRYKGLLEIYGGKKISLNCILVPLESHREFLNKLKAGKVQLKIIHLSVL